MRLWGKQVEVRLRLRNIYIFISWSVVSTTKIIQNTVVLLRIIVYRVIYNIVPWPMGLPVSRLI